MKNIIKKAIQVEEVPTKNFTKKDFVFLAVFVVIGIIVGSTLLYLGLNPDKVSEIQRNNIVQTLDQNDPGERFWFVDSITPIGNVYTIALSNNAGNLQTFEDVLSFGLSNDRKSIVINTGSEIRIINLNTDQFFIAQIPSQQFSGNIGESISWKADNSRYAMGVYIDSDSNKERVWIFNADGTFHKEIDSDLVSEGGAISKVIYQPQNNFILTSTYKLSDTEETNESGTIYLKSEIPIYLTVYSDSSDMVDEVMARDFDTSGTAIFYKWDGVKEDTINYYLYKRTESVNPNQDYLFTKVLVNHE